MLLAIVGDVGSDSIGSCGDGVRGGDDSVGIGDGDDGVDVHGGDGDDSDGGLVVVKSVTALDLERCLVVGRRFQIRRHQVQLQHKARSTRFMEFATFVIITWVFKLGNTILS